ncbi:MAG: LysM peptidoglycan-binding domain-containing protein [Verrucomicrobiae bacterium]|nr:LysM peptidoglycan-binding domain-containing protein [Verrucomicrobiae bacterium]
MSTPNPLVPQGSSLELQAKSKSTVQVAAFIVALHVVILGGLLFLGCKKEERPQGPNLTDTLISPPPVTGDPNALPADPFAFPTNAVASIPDSSYGTQPPVVDPPPVTSPPFTTIPPISERLVPPPFTSSALPSSEYVIKNGDVASRLARAHGVTLKQLQEVNPGVDLSKLKVNQKIQLPAASSAPTPAPSTKPAGSSGSATDGFATHTVRGGENLSKIARRYGVTVKAIRDANGLKSNDIKVAQKLKIPSAAGASKSAAAPGSSASIPAIPSSSPLITPGQPINP